MLARSSTTKIRKLLPRGGKASVGSSLIEAGQLEFRGDSRLQTIFCRTSRWTVVASVPARARKIGLVFMFVFGSELLQLPEKKHCANRRLFLFISVEKKKIVSPVVSPGWAKMGALLITRDD